MNDIIEKRDRIVVSVLELDPASRPRIAATQLCGKDRLPKPRGGANQHHPVVPTVRQRGEQSPSLDYLSPESRRLKSQTTIIPVNNRDVSGPVGELQCFCRHE